MPTVQVALIGIFSLFIALSSGSKCPEEEISRLVVCYYKSETPIGNLNICSCTHLVFESATGRIENYSLEIIEDAKKDLLAAKEKKENLLALFTLVTKPEDSSAMLKSENKSWEQIQKIANLLQESGFDGVELNLQFNSQDGVSKDSYASFVKDLSKTLSNHHRRVKREGYDVFEKVQDDVTTAAYSTQSPKKSTSETPSFKSKSTKQRNRKTRENKSLEEESDDILPAEEGKLPLPKDESAGKFLVFVRLSVKPEIIAKKFDLKNLSRYADILTVPTHDIVNQNENHVTYHPSRLMGLSDILNTDSILDFLTGMGAVKSKMVISLPASVLEFQLKDEQKNTPGSPSSSKPQTMDQSQLCSLFSKNNWTLERDEDLSAPYAFSGKTWLAFEDEISVNIKGKYILLRELRGGAIYPIDADVNDESCKNRTGSGGHLTTTLYKNFRSLERKPRAVVLESLQEQIHGTAFSGIEAGVKLSEYRIVRVVDNSGAVHVIRKNTKTQFECSRQGYFSHPLGCNKFYRCVKFDQYSDEYTVFEYDCPAGLAFDERWEVCVWPGSLPNGAPCTGSSEIAPVPRSHYQCPPREGYYADPENCRWFFACLDHARNGVTPLTAYEFRCPFGLVFSEQKLACDWPWLVGGCGNAGAAGFVAGTSGGSSSASHTVTFINGGNLEASLGQYDGNLQEEGAFGNFGKGFGTVLKEAKGSYLGAQTAGFGYIAGQRDDNNNRASFASLPDYEVSGGRIFNKGGLVLNQNINTIGTSNKKIQQIAPRVRENEQIITGNGYQGRSGGFAGQNTQIHEVSPTISGVQTSGDLSGHVSTIYHPLTPKPFSVDIPSVQINEEGIQDYLHHSTGASSTPRVTQGFSTTLSSAPSSTPKPSVLQTVTERGFSFGSTPKVQVHRFEHPNSFAGEVTINQAVTAGVPVSGAQLFNHASGGLGTQVINEHASFDSSGIQFGQGGGLGVGQTSGNSFLGFTGEGKQSVGISNVTPATLKFGSNEQNGIFGGSTAGPFVGPTKSTIQTVDFTSNRGLGVSQSAGNSYGTVGYTGEGRQSVKISSVTPATLNFGRKELSTISREHPIVPFAVTPKPGIQTVEFTPSGGLGVSHSVGNSYVRYTGERKQSVGISSVTPATFSYGIKEQGAISGGQPAATFAVTSKPGIQTVEFTSSGGLGVSQSVGNSYIGYTEEGKQSVGISSVTPATLNFGKKEQSVISEGQPIVPFAVTPEPGIQTVEFTSSGGSVSQPARNSFVNFNNQIHESGISVGTQRTSGQSVSVHPTSQPSVYSFQSTGSGGSFSPTIAPQPAINTFEQTSIDQEVYRELSLNKPLNSYGVPVVTPKTGIYSYESTRSGFTGSVPASQPVASIVTPRTDFQGFSQGSAGQKLFSAVSPVSKVSFEGPGVSPTTPRTSTFNYNVGQSVRVAVPTQTIEYVTPKSVNFVHTSGQSFGGAVTENPDFGRKSSFSYRKEGSSFGFSGPKSEIHQPAVQPSSGSPFSYSGDFNQLGSIKPLSPKTEFFGKPEANVPSNVVTHVSVDQQPIVSVGTISSINYDGGVPTGKPFTSTAFTPSPPLTNFHLTYLQPEQPTPSPAPSKNLFYQSSVQPLNVNTFTKTSQSVTYEQQQVHAQPTHTKILSPALGIQGTFVNQPQTMNFDQKVINFNEKVKSFTPSVSRSFSSAQKINTANPLDQSNEYLAPVTPEIFASQTPQSLPVAPSSISFGNSFEVSENEKQLHKEQGHGNFGFVRTETVAPHRVNHIEVSTTAPEIKKRPATSKPFLAQEQLLEFSKSVEVNPGQFFESTKTYFPPSQTTPATPLVIQQQPAHLISQKTFKEKEVVGPYYEQGSFGKGEGIGHVQINSIQKGRFENQNALHQGLGQIPRTNGIVYEQKEFFQSVVTPKTVYVPSADSSKPYSFPGVTPKVYVSPAVTAKVYPSPTPRTYLQPAVAQEIYKFSGSSENYLLPELTSKDYEVPEAHAPSGVTPKSYFSSAVTPKTFLQSTVTEEAFGPSAEPPRAYLSPSVTSKTYAGSVVTPKAPLLPSTVYSHGIENVTPGVVLPAQKEVVLTKTKTVDYLPPAGVSVTPNIVVSSTTQAPHNFFSPLTEEITIQQHNNFEFQKVRGGGQVNFISSTTKSPPIFVPSGHFKFNQAQNFTPGHSVFGSSTGINPKIEIPEPPEEYFLSQNADTRRPSSARVSKFKPSESGYFPPQVTTPKATFISVGSVDDHSDNIEQVLNKFSGGYDQVIGHESFGSKVIKGDGKGEIEFGREGSSTVRYEINSSRQRGRGRQYHGSLTSSALPATNKYEEYEIEKERSLGKDGEPLKTTLDLNIGLNKLDKNKKTVIVVSQVSDANPILVGKLAGQCSCQSNMLEIRSKGKNPKEEIRRGNQNQRQIDYPAEASAQSKETVLIGGGKGVSYQTEQSVISSTTASYPNPSSPSILSSLGTDGVLPITPESLFHEARLKNKKKHFRGTTRYLPVPSDFGEKFSGESFLLSPVPASEIASTVEYNILEGGESRAQNEIDGGRGKVLAGAAFDRYGPGGWRSYDETLQGSVDCKRPGLFRHPKHCNKFYACNYDPWKERYTLHVFNCPIQLTYDSSISACNWPIRGPACADDNLLV